MSQSTAPKKKSKVGLVVGLLFVVVLFVGGGAIAVVGLTGIAGAGAGAWFYMASADSAGPVAETSVVNADDARQIEAHNEPSDLAEADAEVSASPSTADDIETDDGAGDTNDGVADAGIGVDDGAAVPAPGPRRRAAPASEPDVIADPLGDLPADNDAGADAVVDDVLNDDVAIKIIYSSPGAAVVIDGNAVGNTPLKVQVAAGSHQISIKDGKASGAFSIDAGFMQDKWCFSSKGKKIEAVGC